MDHIGIDVHKKESQICILADGGELIERRIRTEPARFAEVLGERPCASALLRQRGWRVPTGMAEGFSRRVAALPLPGQLLSEVAPLLAVMRQVHQQLAYSGRSRSPSTRQRFRAETKSREALGTSSRRRAAGRGAPPRAGAPARRALPRTSR